MTTKHNPFERKRYASGYKLENSLHVRTILLLVSVLLISQTLNAQIPDVRQDLMNLNQLNYSEQVYLHTDCELYAPGDTIWFRAYIRNRYSLEKSRLSQVFHLALVNEKGNIVSFEKYLISDSQSSGYMVIHNKQSDGPYFLYGYSSWMKNFEPEDIYNKRILILRDINRGKRIIPHFNKTAYQPGDTVRVMVSYYDDLNNKLEGNRFRYRFSVDREVTDRGGAFSEATETSPLEFIIPDSATGSPILHIWDNDNISSTIEIPTQSDIRVEFFPEGGNCLLDELGIMAFKATYPDGQAADLKGIIIDERGEELSYVKTDHDGMGKFMFQPRENKKYSLKITEPVHSTKQYELPEGRKNAWSMQVNPVQDNIHVQIKNSLPAFDTCLFMLSIRGFTDYFRWIRTESEAAFIIPTKDFPPGIAVLTLLDKYKMPQAERLVFLNHDIPEVIGLSTNRKKYLCRDSVILDIDLSHMDSIYQKGQYSLTVFDQEFGSSRLIDEADIFAASYLKPEIRGEIHQPNYYFGSDNREVRYHLDLLLLTQGWRTYRYERLLQRIDSASFPVNQDLIKGRIERFRFGRAPQAAEAKINLYFGGSWIDINTDESGSFNISPEYDAESLTPTVFTAKDIKGSEKVMIEIDEDLFQERLKNYLAAIPDSVGTAKDPLSYILEDVKRSLNINANHSIWIEEVEITRNIKPDSIDVEEELIKSLYNVRSANEELIYNSNDLLQILMSMGLTVKEDYENDNLLVFFQGKFASARFIVDGFNMGENFSSINSMFLPPSIESVYVARGLDAYQLYDSNIIVYIKLKDGSNYNIGSEDIYKNYVYIPILKVNKEFYSPAYRTEAERNFPVPDIRKTIYWDPEIILDENGKARVVFFNSDRYTRVKCILEGMSDKGVPVHKEALYDITIYRE